MDEGSDMSRGGLGDDMTMANGGIYESRGDDEDDDWEGDDSSIVNGG